MKVLVVGSGGREHAICLSLIKSPKVKKLFCAPGNGGISAIAKCIDIAATDIEQMVSFAQTSEIDFVIVAPDDPLALGMVDALESVGISAFGPRKSAAIIESSKVFSKELMRKYDIPTAKYEIFSNADDAKSYIRETGAPIVIKADGLALGKGVIVATDLDMATHAVDSIMTEKRFGDSGKKIVVEEFMTGPEVTILAFTDGRSIEPMVSSCDYKRAFDDNLGLNTGGMGAFAPSPYYTNEIASLCMNTIFKPTIEAMRNENRVFKGVIYFGLMITESGPKVIEYNARFGDPETQAILPMLKTDLLDIFEAIVDERLHEIDVKWEDGASCCVVMASGGYPQEYTTGYEMFGLDRVPRDVIVYHAGTTLSDKVYRTNGGRVLGITAKGKVVSEAASKAYEGLSGITFKDMHFRTDIGKLFG